PEPSRDPLDATRREGRVRPHHPPGKQHHRVHRYSTTLALVALMSLFAVSVSSSTAVAAPPSLTIVSPTDGALIANDTPVLVDFRVSHFVFVQPGRVGQVGCRNDGHATVFLDAR